MEFQYFEYDVPPAKSLEFKYFEYDVPPAKSLYKLLEIDMLGLINTFYENYMLESDTIRGCFNVVKPFIYNNDYHSIMLFVTYNDERLDYTMAITTKEKKVVYDLGNQDTFIKKNIISLLMYTI